MVPRILMVPNEISWAAANAEKNIGEQAVVISRDKTGKSIQEWFKTV